MFSAIAIYGASTTRKILILQLVRVTFNFFYIQTKIYSMKSRELFVWSIGLSQ